MEDPNARLRERLRERRRDDRNDDEVRLLLAGAEAPRGSVGGLRPTGIRLTLAVDTQANELIVSCNETLFRQIRVLVEQRDVAAAQVQPQIRVIQLDRTNVRDLGIALDGLLPRVTMNGSEFPAGPAADRDRRQQSTRRSVRREGD
jgi:hypothetical protein